MMTMMTSSTTIFLILLCLINNNCSATLADNDSSLYLSAPSATTPIAVVNATSSVATRIVERPNTKDITTPFLVEQQQQQQQQGLVLATAPMNNNNNNNKLAAAPVVEANKASSTRNNNNNKIEVTLQYVSNDGTTTVIPLGSLDEIPQVRRVLTRAPKGRIMLRHPSDPTTTWSVNEDGLYDWLEENALQWAHDYDYVLNNEQQDDSATQQQQQQESKAVPVEKPLSIKDAICASVSDAVNQLVTCIQTMLWWTAALAFLTLCVWVVAMALTLDAEANNHQRNHQFNREQEMLRVATIHAAALRQNGQRPFFLCPQQWEERCLDEAMKTLYNVSYFNTRHYQNRNNNNNNNNNSSSSVPIHCFGFQQPQSQSQIYRHCY